MSDVQDQQKIDMESFANMVGFPTELIKKELFSENIDDQELTMDDLRKAMLKYLDSTMSK